MHSELVKERNTLNANAYNRLAMEANKNRNYEMSVHYCSESIKLNSSNKLPWMIRAIGNKSLGNNQDAIADCTRALQIDPKCRISIRERGYNHFILNNYACAINDLSLAIQLTPKDNIGLSKIYFFRGKSYSLTNKPNEAIEDFQNAHGLQPNNPSISFYCGEVYLTLKKYNEASREFTKIIKLKSTHLLEAYIERSRIHTIKKNYPSAILDLLEAIKLDSNNPILHNNIGSLYYQIGKYDEAILHATRALELNAYKAVYYTNRGLAYHKLNQYTHAILDYMSALKIDANLEHPSNKLIILLTNLTTEDLRNIDRKLIFDAINILPHLQKINWLQICLNENSALYSHFELIDSKTLGIFNHADNEITHETIKECLKSLDTSYQDDLNQNRSHDV